MKYRPVCEVCGTNMFFNKGLGTNTTVYHCPYCHTVKVDLETKTYCNTYSFEVAKKAMGGISFEEAGERLEAFAKAVKNVSR